MEMKKQEQERQAQEQARQRFEENKKRLEEANLKRKEMEEQQKKKMEEQKKKLEDMKKQREEEAKQRKEAMEKRAREMRALTEMRKAQQKVRVAKAEDFEEVKRQLEEVLEREAQNLSDDAQKTVQEDCEKIVAQAQKRIDAVHEGKRKEEEKKLEEARKQKELEEKAEELLTELKNLVEVAEAGLEKLKERATAFKVEADLSPEAVDKAAAVIKETGLEAEALATQCSEFFRKHHPAMKLAPSTKPAPGDTGKDKDQAESRQVLSRLLQKVGTMKREAGTTVEAAMKTKAALQTRASARQLKQEEEALFKKYDRGSDGMLSKKKLQAYSMGEWSFTVPESTLNSIFEHHSEYSAKQGERGIKFEDFQLVKSIIGVAREVQRDKGRRADREAREKRLEECKVQMQERIKKATEAVSEAEQGISKAEEEVKPLASKSKGLRVPEMKVLAEGITVAIGEAKELVAAAAQKMAGLKEDLEKEFQKELIAYISKETKMHDSKMGRMDGRVKRAENLLSRFTDEVSKKRAVEVDKTRLAALKVARHDQQVKGLSEEEFFQCFDTASDGAIDADHFLAYFDRAEKAIRPFKAEDEAGETVVPDDSADPETVELNPDDLAEVFSLLCASGESTISKDAFTRHIIPNYFVVVKQTALTDKLGIKESQTLRRLEIDEVLKVLKGPVKEAASGVLRTQIRSLKDETVGWVSPIGNAGTVFLKEGGRQRKVIKETVLTDSFEMDGGAGDSAPKPTKLKAGEVVDVEEWPRKEETSGLMRMKVRVRSTGATGWVTSTGNQGTSFFQVV